MHVPVQLNLTKAQILKAMKGGAIQLSADAVRGSKHKIMVHPETAKRIAKAKRLHKGVRITLTPEEVQMSGEGLKEIFEGIKNAGQWLKKNVIDTDFYQKNIRPIAKEVVRAGVDLLPVGKDLARKGVDWAGERTGAFGVRQSYGGAVATKGAAKTRKTKKCDATKGAATRGADAVERDDFSPLLDVHHPAMHPPLPLKFLKKDGGSFKTAKGMRGRGRK